MLAGLHLDTAFVGLCLGDVQITRVNPGARDRVGDSGLLFLALLLRGSSWQEMATVPPLLAVPHALGAGWQLLQATHVEIISQF